MSTSTRMPAYFLSHGGGPWPWLTGPMRDDTDSRGAANV